METKYITSLYFLFFSETVAFNVFVTYSSVSPSYTESRAINV